MKHWTQQAKKNKLDYSNHGDCPLCGAALIHGLYECVEKAAFITHLFDHQKGIDSMVIFLSTDAHALSHSEIHGRWNNHFHLARLHLILILGVQWHYKLSPKLSAVLNDYKLSHPHEYLHSPPPLHRGLTVTDVEKSTNHDQHIMLVREWAHQVYNSFKDHHHIAETIALKFLKNNR